MPRKSSNILTIVVAGEQIELPQVQYYDVSWKEVILKGEYTSQNDIPANFLKAVGLEIESET